MPGYATCGHMSTSRQSARFRAIGLCAARDRADGLEVLDALAAPLREGAREVVLELLEDPRQDVHSRLVEDLVELLELDLERLGKRWERASGAGEIRPLVGVRRILAAKMPSRRASSELPAPLTRFVGDELFRSLTTLSGVVLRRAALGEHWAKAAATMAAEECGEISARLAPAVACLALALSHDDTTGDGVIAEWPDSLARSFERCRSELWHASGVEQGIQLECLEVVNGESRDDG